MKFPSLIHLSFQLFVIVVKTLNNSHFSSGKTSSIRAAPLQPVQQALDGLVDSCALGNLHQNLLYPSQQLPL
ncbi:unnamed protein product [Cunninghamella echinulata]